MSKYGYKETKEHLSNRINSYTNRSTFNLNNWIINIINPTSSDILLDICCGNGNQTLMYADICKKVVGVDINKDIIKSIITDKKNVDFKLHDIDKRFCWKKNTFDIVCCSYGIYYADNIENTISEMKRVLKKDGKLFICGPVASNSIELNNLHMSISNCDISIIYDYRSRRMEEEVIPYLIKEFGDIRISKFENKLKFTDIDSFMKYYSSSLLFKENTIDELSTYKKMKEKIESKINLTGSYSIIKRGIGVLAQ